MASLPHDGRDVVVLSWLAVVNDPFNEDGSPGPSLTLLCGPDSSFRGRVSNGFVFYNDPDHRDIGRHLEKEVEKRDDQIAFSLKHVDVNPIDHQAIFERLRDEVGAIREQFPSKKLVIHVSPGTAAMHTVWVLMAETGLIEPPFKLVQSLRRKDRSGEDPIVPVEIGLETPLKTYRAARPEQATSTENRVQTDPIKSKSKLRKRLYQQAEKVASLKVPVLLMGERGTGKSTLASWIRSNSPFRRTENDSTPPQVACGQFTSELVRSELFGHVEGAFTGAKSDREGLLKVADGDTLFLDEIGDLDSDVQRLLIRAIENKEYTPEGSDETFTSDFRLITATNLNWRELNDRLAADFLDRISYFILEVPPLRKTPEDLPHLWRDVVRQAADRAGIGSEIVERIMRHDDRIVDILQEHPLPGNFRDLFSLAYHVFAEFQLEDVDVKVEAAIDRGLEVGLREKPADPESDLVGTVIQSFGRGVPLPPEVMKDERLSTKEVQDRLRRYLGEEIRRVAKLRNESPSDICDVSNRALQKWRKL